MKVVKLLAVFLLFSVTSAFAHFQLIYTPESKISEDAKQVDFKMVFTHPFDAGHTMDIGKNEAGDVKGFEEFFIVHKGKKTDALPGLKKSEFTSLENSGVAFDFSLNKDFGFRGGGDWVMVAIPHPYYEGAEDIYIQQATKVMINKSDIATDWAERCAPGFPEIMPLVKPYDVWTGGLFSGVVLDGSGNPVPFAEIEVEYMNYDVDMNASKFTGEKKIKKEGHGAAVILANAEGRFDFIPPKPGYWGFAALGAGGDLSFDGKELSQDAVIWIEAYEIGNSAETAAAVPADKASENGASAESKKSSSTMIYIVLIAIAAVIVIAAFRKKKK